MLQEVSKASGTIEFCLNDAQFCPICMYAYINVYIPVYIEKKNNNNNKNKLFDGM